MFYEFLANFQKERTNQNAIIPALTELENEYRKKGFSLDFIARFFSEVFLSKNGPKFLISAYLFNAIELCCFANLYNQQDEYANEIEEKLAEQIKHNKKHKGISVSVEELDDYLSQEEIEELFGFWHKKVQFCLSIKNKIENNPKDVLQSFIDSL